MLIGHNYYDMGKALYREYRPKSLETVVGQEHITETLKNAIKKGSISHAYLFTGPRGVGKTSVARILAYEINGIPYDEETTQLDIIEIDAASNRRIDEIRDLRDKVHIAPTSSKYKVYIIDEVHMLTREAFNALLKTLEEPPAHIVFILATTELHKVPETIISRTQRFSFKPIDVEASKAHLRTIADKEKIDITDDALVLIAEHGSGSFRDSISMLDQIAGFSNDKITSEKISLLMGVPNNEIIEEMIESVRNNNPDLLFDSVQKLKENGANSAKTAQSIIKYLKNELLESRNSLTPETAINIMKTLLALTGAQSSFEAIEIALLDAMNFESAPTTQSKKTETIERENIPIQTEEEAPKKSDKVTDDKVDEQEDNFKSNNKEQDSDITSANNSWNDVLKLLKAKHNTLYGVLRMADTKVENDKIILTFQFEFHKKQLQQTKNMATLKAIVDEQLGSGYIIESEVIKKTKNQANTAKSKSSNDTLSSVSNIFGGAELLES